MINYNDYRPPGASVDVRREDQLMQASATQFLTVIVGSGNSVRDKKIKRLNIKADTTDFPYVNLTWGVEKEFNFQQVPNTEFTLSKVTLETVTSAGVTQTALQKGVDYDVVYNALPRTYEGKLVSTIYALPNGKIKESSSLFNIEVDIHLSDDAFDLRLMDVQDLMNVESILGPKELIENDVQMFNDVAMASEIAFKLGVRRFLYLEVPRNFGEKPTSKDFQKVIERIYFEKDAWRVVALTDDEEVINAVEQFVKVISNPTDRRECVGFVTYPPSKISDHGDMTELIQKVGGLSQAINSERIVNVYGGVAVEFPVGTKRYLLPSYFLCAGVAFLDDSVGMSLPLSTRTLNSVFSKIITPRFRPAQWNELAKRGVFIVLQEREGAPITIRHQLTTQRSTTDIPETTEYSITKNIDATVKLVRDFLAPYAGQENITDGYLEKVNSAFTSAKVTAQSLGYVADLIQLTPWELRKIDNGINNKVVKTNIVSQYRYVPLYPGNNIDVHFII